MKFKTILFLTFLFCLCCNSAGKDLESKAAQAETAFTKGQLNEALALYKELEEAGIQNSLIYERMADANQDLGLKVYYLRKAMEFDCSSCKEKIEEIRTKIKFNPILKKPTLISNNLRAVIIVFTSLVFGISVILYNFVAINIFLLCFIPSIAALTWISSGTYCGTDNPKEIESCILRGKRHNQQHAIVVTDKALALSSQNPESQAVLELPKGAEILVSEIKNGWAQLLLPNHRSGWIMSENLKFLD